MNSHKGNTGKARQPGQVQRQPPSAETKHGLLPVGALLTAASAPAMLSMEGTESLWQSRVPQEAQQSAPLGSLSGVGVPNPGAIYQARAACCGAPSPDAPASETLPVGRED